MYDMNETLRDYLEDLQKDIRIEMNDHSLHQRAHFYGRLADWAYRRQEQLIKDL